MTYLPKDSIQPVKEEKSVDTHFRVDQKRLF